ncbi:regulatory protein RecX [Microbacterium mangrovi]|uniref:regulatory protein RecX n=1 Tax=Microbacterium mangrovi TaxID=1348253 RepID=UPI00068BABDC|nr:regulatory protein RecX [Microbacterium mangrovi]
MDQWHGSDETERDDLAPVIPLFAQRMPTPTGAASARAIAPNHPAFAGGARTGRDDAEAATAPRAAPEPLRPSRSHSVRFVELDESEPAGFDADDAGHDAAGPAVAQAHAEFAEKALLRKLRTRSLSVREARAVLVGFDLAGEAVDDIVNRFEQSRYLDDAALAEQLVHTGSARKGQGRQAIAQTMAGRGIPREVADAALADLPDDDLERALDYARTKAVSLARLDPQTGLRRLMGQLTRRGYPSHIAMTAARQALDEQSRPRGPRFS